MYLPGFDSKGQTEFVKFNLEGWVIPELALNLLIGNSLLDAYKANINYVSHIVDF